MEPITTTGAILIVANKLLGKTADKIAIDIAGLYDKGKDMIFEATNRKVSNINDGKQANLRVARDVFFNGSFSDEAICAEYFGGILAASRSDDGRDDQGIYYVDLIKGLSSKQLNLHYVLYRSLNKNFISNPEKNNLNVGQSTELHRERLYISSVELIELGLRVDIDLEALYRKGLLHEYKYDQHPLGDNKAFPYTMFVPTTLGIQLFSIANNELENWRTFPIKDFGDFKDIKTPILFDSSIESISKKLENYDHKN